MHLCKYILFCVITTSDHSMQISSHLFASVVFLLLINLDRLVFSEGSSTTSSSSNSTDRDDSVCQSMANPNNDANKGILCVGQLTGDRLVVITKDYYVFLLPTKSLTDTIDKLYINGTKPTPLAEKWPVLDKDDRFRFVTQHMYNSFVWVSPNEVNYIFFTMKQRALPPQDKHKRGVAYNVDHPEVYTAVNYHGSDDQVLIGSYKSNKFYAINKDANNVTRITTFHKECDDPDCPIDPDLPWKRLCKGDSGPTIKVEDDSNAPCADLGWEKMDGFIFNGKFYLFGSNFVVLFPEEVYNKKNQPVQMEVIKYNSFVQCGGTINVPFNPDGTQHNTEAPVKWGIIAAIVLIIVLLLLCCLLLLMRQAFVGGKKRKRGHSSRKLSAAGGGAGHKHTPGSVRSRGLVGAGKLTTAGGKGSKARRSSTAQPPGTRASVRSKGSSLHPGQMSRNMRGSKTRSVHSKQPKGSKAITQATNRSRLKPSTNKASLTRGSSHHRTALTAAATERSKLRHH